MSKVCNLYNHKYDKDYHIYDYTIVRLTVWLNNEIANKKKNQNIWKTGKYKKISMIKS